MGEVGFKLERKKLTECETYYYLFRGIMIMAATTREEILAMTDEERAIFLDQMQHPEKYNTPISEEFLALRKERDKKLAAMTPEQREAYLEAAHQINTW